ncbi:MAG: FkbM family methyltransferase [Rhodobacter sp.]|uniref:hypothetical protein n=1 Tax=Pararhodobacter sp. TaxID=2127056 RepID=UPI001DAD1AD7|nr:hypothetical protein [Pararhodobacter sp.]MCB1344017.1 FkbM family methyltransferase [Paracoccaceae bacterium]MCC0072152.1 FkbM family methyltransferase [Rhodobacter sp.]HPD91905.1 hypothetical protein [Pararhodobacter sp.]
MKFMKRQRRTAILWLLDRLGVSTEVFHPYGVEVHVPKGSDLSMRYNLTRKVPYEVGEATLIRKYVTPGTHVIELGGCVGVISALTRSVIGPEARQIVVEAEKALVPVCGANAARGALPGAALAVHAAVDYSGAPFVRFATGHNAHVGHVAQPGEDGNDVPTTTLTRLMEGFPDDGPAALICDIEGAELALCHAEQAALARFSVIVMELHPGVYPGGDRDQAALESDLRAAGFTPVETIDQVTCFVRA